MTVTPEIRDAVAAAMGYEVEDDVIRNAVARTTGWEADTLDGLQRELDARGGRGVDLAERIDTLRIGLAARRPGSVTNRPPGGSEVVPPV